MGKSILLLLLIGLLSACASTDKMMKSWVHHHVSELIGVWGPPSAVYDDSRCQGCKIIVYTGNQGFVTPGSATTNVYANPYGGTINTTYNPALYYNVPTVRTFYTDFTGEIWAYAWKGGF